MMYNNSIHSSFNDGSGDVQATIRQYISQIKLLNNDNQLKTQQVEILKEKVKELDQVNIIYKKQLANVEAKLKMYDQELRLKIQSSEDKSVKLNDSNATLQKKVNQLQFRVDELEEKSKTDQSEIQALLKEVRELRNNSTDNEDELVKLRHKTKLADDEIMNLNKNLRDLSLQNQEYSSKCNHLIKDNENMMRILEENDDQLKKFNKMQHQFRDVQAQLDKELLESGSMKKNYESLKQKYDELFYDYNLLLMSKKEYDEFMASNGKVRLISVEKQVSELKDLLVHKDRELTDLRDEVLETKNEMKERLLKYDSEVKKATSLMDGFTTAFNVKSYSENVAMQLLLEGIARQNREQQSLSDKVKLALGDIRELKLNANQLTEERNNLKNTNEDLSRQLETLNHRLMATVEEASKSMNHVHASYEDKINQIVRANKDAEEKFAVLIAKKDEEMHFMREGNDSLRNEAQRAKEEKRKVIEFLHQQEDEIKDFKDKFFQIAEETSLLKLKVTKSSYLIATILKVAFNLLSKYESLAHQKAFLTQFFDEYLVVKKKLGEANFIEQRPSVTNKKNYQLYNKFRRIGFVVIAGNRLRRLQLKHIGLKTDSYEVRHNLEDFPENLKRFFIDLFRSNKFIIDKDFVTSIGETLKSNDLDDENAVVSKLFAITNKFNKIGYDPESNFKYVKFYGKTHIEELSHSLKLKEELSDRLKKNEDRCFKLEQELRLQDQEYRTELESALRDLKQTQDMNIDLRVQNEKLNTDNAIANQKINHLLEIVDDKKVLVDITNSNKGLDERCKSLYEHVNQIVRQRNQLEKEIELKNFKILELEKNMLQKSLGSDENSHILLESSIPRETAGKAPGKIVRSSDRKNNSAMKETKFNE